MKAFVLSLAVLVLPGAASAQSAEARAAMRSIEVHQFQDQFNQALHTAALEQQQDLYRDSVSPRRAERAERAAALINSGDCDGARELALRANDQRMLARIEHACEAAPRPN